MSTININDRFGENKAICSWKEVGLHFIENIRWFAWIGVPWSSWVLDDAFPRQAVPDVVARFVVRENPWTQCWHGALCQARGMALGMTRHWRTTWKLEEWKSWDLKKAGVSKELLSTEKETWSGLRRAQDVPRKMISGGGALSDRERGSGHRPGCGRTREVRLRNCVRVRDRHRHKAALTQGLTRKADCAVAGNAATYAIPYKC